MAKKPENHSPTQTRKPSRSGKRSAATAVAEPSQHGSQSGQSGSKEGGSKDSLERCFKRNARAFEPTTLNRDNRTVQSVLATEDPVPIYDWRSGEVVDEVLLASGCRAESSTPLLRDHNQWTVLAMLGEVTGVKSSGDEVHGLLTFGRDLDPEAEGIWKRVDQSLLRRGSVGYYYERKDYETIPAGETRTIGGRTFTASKERAKRIVKRWDLLEYSMVVVPADSRATLRSADSQEDSQGTAYQDSSNSHLPLAPKRTQSPEDQMKKFLRFLHQHGLASTVNNETEALDWARSGNLSAELIAQLDQLCKEESVTFDPAAARAKQVETGQRSGGTLPSGGGSGSGTGTQPVDPTQAVREERQRVASIRQLHREHPEVPQSVVDNAIDQGWDINQTTREFLSGMRNGRTPGAPAIQIRGSEQINRRVLQAALMQRCEITPDSPVLRSQTAQALRSRRRELDIAWAINCPQSGQRRDELEQAFDIADQQGLRGASFMHVAELCCELQEPGRRFHGTDEILERAFSSGDFSAVFGAVVHMELLASYERTPHTYNQWCEVVEYGDFNTHKANDMGQVGRLKKMGKNGGKAPLLNVEDPFPVELALERYAGMLVVDEQTLIGDAFGVTGYLPSELGETCHSMVADLAFSQLLSTGNLSDTRARFNNTDGNIVAVSGSLSEAAWSSIGAALKNQKVGNRRINIGQALALCGTTLAPSVKKWMTSMQNSDQMTNPHRDSYSVAEDTAIDLGVTDPANEEATIAGTPASFYVLGTGTKRSIKFGWRRGTGRGPVTGPAINLSATTPDQWGLAWKTYLDMGAAFQRRKGAVKVTIS